MLDIRPKMPLEYLNKEVKKTDPLIHRQEVKRSQKAEEHSMIGGSK
jgi:hypothetical protein